MNKKRKKNTFWEQCLIVISKMFLLDALLKRIAFTATLVKVYRVGIPSPLSFESVHSL